MVLSGDGASQMMMFPFGVRRRVDLAEGSAPRSSRQHSPQETLQYPPYGAKLSASPRQETVADFSI